jgi:hypothetical protein
VIVEIPTADFRSSFTAEELDEFEAGRLSLSDTVSRTALDLAEAWAANVDKIDVDRTLEASDRTVWTEHDLAGALFLRDHLRQSLNGLRPALSKRLEQHIAETDDRFRSFTVEDSGRRMARIAAVDLAGRDWWWFRVPASGPIAVELSNYTDGPAA